MKYMGPKAKNKLIYIVSDSQIIAELLCSYLNNCAGIIISGLCNDSNKINKILDLLKIDVVIVIGSKCKFINGCCKLIVNKPLLFICPDETFEKTVLNTKNDIGKDFQIMSLHASITELQEKIAILSNSKLNSPTLKDYSHISNREKEILKLICNGKNTKEIADILFLSIKTIENHRNNILKKTKHTSMMTLVNELYKIGFLS